MHDVVKLNIGGQKFMTTTATLTKYCDTFFTSMLSQQMPTTMDEEGCYFIDRDGHFFAPILTWLRTDEISIPSTISKADVIREARYYLLFPLIEALMIPEEAPIQPRPALECPTEMQKFVDEYWTRHEEDIMNILSKLNKDGRLHVILQIIPGHRQDIERPPQMQFDQCGESGRLYLHMNFTVLHISKYARVQTLLANCFSQKGFSGFFRPGEQITLWWNPPEVQRENDIVFFGPKSSVQ